MNRQTEPFWLKLLRAESLQLKRKSTAIALCTVHRASSCILCDPLQRYTKHHLLYLLLEDPSATERLCDPVPACVHRIQLVQIPAREIEYIFRRLDYPVIQVISRKAGLT